jgi:hypothetical protein
MIRIAIAVGFLFTIILIKYVKVKNENSNIAEVSLKAFFANQDLTISSEKIEREILKKGAEYLKGNVYRFRVEGDSMFKTIKDKKCEKIRAGGLFFEIASYGVDSVDPENIYRISSSDGNFIGVLCLTLTRKVAWIAWLKTPIATS